MREALVRQVWTGLGAPHALDGLELTGPEVVWPSAFDVTGLAVASVSAASLAVADLAGASRVAVDSREACAAFHSERLFSPIGWELPPPWDPIAGDYPTADGWIRLHTNYAHHRTAATAALGLGDDASRESVAAAVRERAADELEQAVVDAGGCAAALRDRAAWLQHPAGATAAALPLVDLRATGARTRFEPVPDRPLDGLSVLDLTRVIAGPVCTRLLAAHGADVLRIDPPGFAEVPALLPVTTEGKRCAALDLSTPTGRETFLALLHDADVLVHGLRPGALDRLGLGADVLADRFPHLVTGQLSAYGTVGPWGGRRGFDSLVQMSAGIVAAESARAGGPGLSALPAQALDHATGYLLAAGICRLLADATSGTATAALAATAELLATAPAPDAEPAGLGEPRRPERSTAWGPAGVVPVAGRVGDLVTDLPRPAGPLGRHEPVWS
ncbi:CoA transferase [Nocardioides sp. MH1]|uniref:CoA transferase n=1 Tax=Nocardioides sp. MH1 TaxID=3242490 RepID=UPI0035215C70